MIDVCNHYGVVRPVNGDKLREGDGDMQSTTASATLLFAISVVLQLVFVFILPMTRGYENPWPTAIALAAINIAMWLFARLVHNGAQLSTFMPFASAIVPLSTVIFGVLFLHESTSPYRIGLLVLACLLIGTANRFA